MTTSTDTCDALDTENEYFCHVCTTDNKLHYAKINTELARATLYGHSVPHCAKQKQNKAHLRAFSHECFPSGMGELRRSFFAGHHTMACSDLQSNPGGNMVMGIIWTAVFILVCAFIASMFVRSRRNLKPKIKVNLPAPSPASSLPSPLPRVIKIPYTSFNRV